MSVLPMLIATLSCAVASPFSYVVSPVEVISIGAFSGVLISPQIKPALAKKAASNKTSVRMRTPKVLHQKLPAKPKPLHTKDEYYRGVRYEPASKRNHSRSLLINLAINGFLHPG